MRLLLLRVITFNYKLSRIDNQNEKDFGIETRSNTSTHNHTLASVGILREEREPELGKLGWYGNFDTGFKRNISFKIPGVRVF